MLNRAHFTQNIVTPALHLIGLWSPAAEQLVVGTAVAESKLTYLIQVGGGPARGLFQIEPRTHDDLWTNFLEFNPELKNRVISLTVSNLPRIDQLIWNLYYSTAMCRILYRRIKEALPKADDWSGQAAYWKKYYNTYKGAGSVEHFLRANSYE